MNFTHDQLVERAFLRVAHVMHGMWEEKGTSDTRLLESPLIPDEYVLIGESIQGNECREHVIPRNVICNQCHMMFSDAASVDEVAKFTRTYLKIVCISKDERHMLDHGKNLNLRQRMPDGWTFTDGDPYARLILAGIKFRERTPKPFAKYSAASRLALRGIRPDR